MIGNTIKAIRIKAKRTINIIVAITMVLSICATSLLSPLAVEEARATISVTQDGTWIKVVSNPEEEATNSSIGTSLYLHLKPHTVSFNTNGGNATGLTDISNVPYNNTIDKPSAIPTLNGYKFEYWKKSDGTQWKFNGESGAMGVDSDLTLYAHYSPKSYQFTLSQGRGISDMRVQIGSGSSTKWNAASPTYSIPYGSEVTVTVTVDQGYRSTWVQTGLSQSDISSRSETTFTFTMPAQSVTLNAKSIAADSSIAFDPGTAFGDKTLRNMPAGLLGQTGQLILSSESPFPTDMDDPSTFPTRDGYTFSGWKDSDNKSVTGYPDKFSAGSVTYTAQWVASDSAIVFDANADGDAITGTLPTGLTGKTGDEIASRTLPTHDVTTRTHNYNDGTTATYTFTGWIDENGAEVTTYPNTMPPGVTKYYAKWVEEQGTINVDQSTNENANFAGTRLKLHMASHNVTFDTNGSSDSIAPRLNVPYNKTIDAPSDPSLEGYSFGGWHIGSASGELFHFNGEKDDNDNPIAATEVKRTYNLVASWIPNAHNITVSYDSDFIDSVSITIDSTGVTGATTPTARAGQKILMIATPASGFTFGQWSGAPSNGYTDGVDGCELYFDMPDKDVDIKAYSYEETNNVRTIQFNVDGGSAVADAHVIDGGKITEPTVTKTGYKNAGWFQNPSFTPSTEWDFDNDTVTADMTLYVKWEKDVQVITLQNNTTPDNITPTGGLSTIYQWNGIGFYEDDPRTNSSATAVTVLSQVPDHLAKGYVFTGYFDNTTKVIEPDGTLPTKSDGSGGTVVNNTYFTSDKALTAGWTERTDIKYTIVCKDSDGKILKTTDSLPTKYKFGQTGVPVSAPTITGYKLKSGQNSPQVITIDMGPSGDGPVITFIYEKQQMTVKFDLDGGTATGGNSSGGAIPDKTPDYDTAINNPTADIASGGDGVVLTKEHYNFNGWRRVLESGSVETSDYDFLTPVTENFTLIAQWTLKEVANWEVVAYLQKEDCTTWDTADTTGDYKKVVANYSGDVEDDVYLVETPSAANEYAIPTIPGFTYDSSKPNVLTGTILSNDDTNAPMQLEVYYKRDTHPIVLNASADDDTPEAITTGNVTWTNNTDHTWSGSHIYGVDLLLPSLDGSGNVGIVARPGYVFEGWYDSLGNKVIKVEDSYIPDTPGASTTFTARWTARIDVTVPTQVSFNATETASGYEVVPPEMYLNFKNKTLEEVKITAVQDILDTTRSDPQDIFGAQYRLVKVKLMPDATDITKDFEVSLQDSKTNSSGLFELAKATATSGTINSSTKAVRFGINLSDWESAVGPDQLHMNKSGSVALLKYKLEIKDTNTGTGLNIWTGWSDESSFNRAIEPPASI